MARARYGMRSVGREIWVTEAPYLTLSSCTVVQINKAKGHQADMAEVPILAYVLGL
jgi:hypothetical protein